MVNWTAEKDAQLLLGIFEFQQITFSQPLLKHLAEKIGDGCTPKAVNHRLTNLKNKGKAAAEKSGTPSKDDKDDGTGTPKSTGKRGRPKKVVDDDEDGMGSPTPKKRGRKAKVKVDEEEEIKKVMAKAEDDTENEFDALNTGDGDSEQEEDVSDEV